MYISNKHKSEHPWGRRVKPPATSVEDYSSLLFAYRDFDDSKKNKVEKNRLLKKILEIENSAAQKNFA